MSTTPPDPDFEAMLAKVLGKSQHDPAARSASTVLNPADPLPEGHKSGYVAVIGQPNVGKSTLMNQLLGEKIAIVSPKPQTTRLRQLGILTREDLQIVFVDTPGIHRPQDELGRFMVDVAQAALQDADLILFLSDVSRGPNRQDRAIAETLAALNSPAKIIQVLNKVDAAKDPGVFEANYTAHRALLPDSPYAVIAAIDGHKVADLLAMIMERLPLGPRYYDPDQVSDLPIRWIAGEMIREQVLRRAYQEVPHSVAVEVEEFKQRENGVIYLRACIYVERDGQKAILIGKGGGMLKDISSLARQDIEKFLQTRLFMEVQVKVWEGWRKDPTALRRFGYRIESR